MAKRKQKQGVKQYAYQITTGAFGVIIVVVAAALIIGGFKLREQKAYYASQEELYTAMIADEEARTEDLKEQQTYVQTKQYIEDVARNQLHMVYPDEYVFVSK